MARFALITFPGGGNLPPLMRMVTELMARGHEVHVLAAPDVARSATDVGAPFVPLPEMEFWDWSVARSVPTSLAQVVRLQSDRPLERRVLAELRRLRPDVVLVDCLVSGCARSAAAVGYRTVVLFHTYLDFWTKSVGRGPVGMLTTLRGRSMLRSWAAADLRIVMCDEMLDPSVRPSGATVWTGSCERGVAAEREDPPLVVASLSTSELPGQADAYRRIIAALGTLPVRAIVTVGGAELEHGRTPPNVELRGFAPHAELFPRASLVISHGGLSTAFRALAHGVPLLLLPMNPLMDQPMVARSVQSAGAGLMIRRTATPEVIAAATTRILQDASFAATAAAIGERLRDSDGASRAADAVQELLATTVAG
ncbi:MAG: glycosyltransferase [Actinobacteria bacterium]|nr:glycosyltransferase [Actinomycetota bacterium]